VLKQKIDLAFLRLDRFETPRASPLGACRHDP
jgi:hypothetical protein